MSKKPVQLSRLESMESLRSTVIKEYENLQADFDWNGDTDIRLRVFQQIDNLIRSYSLTLLFYEDHLSSDTYMAEKVKPTTFKDARDVRLTFLVFVQNSYIYNLTGIVEGAFRSILRAVVPNDKGYSGFKRIKANLLYALNGPEPEHSRDAVTLLFMIRNCVHNNGVHYARNENDAAISYRGGKYNFQHGKPQKNATFQTILHISVDVVRLLRYVVKHKRVQGLDAIREIGI